MYADLGIANLEGRLPLCGSTEGAVAQGGCWQRETGCEHRSAGSDKPSAEIGLAGAGRPGAAAAAIEISPPANRSARPSRDAAWIIPLLHSPARLRLSLCQIRLGEYPPPVSFIHRDGRPME